MTNDTLSRLEALFEEFPCMCATSVPGDDEVQAAEKEVGIVFPADYREFLLRFGGAMVGPYPIYGLRSAEVMEDGVSVIDVTSRYRGDGVPGCDDWIVFSADHCGNPVGMDSSGAVWIHDHDFGGIAPLAKDFEEYLRDRCLHLPSA